MTDAISRSAVLEALESEKGRVMAEKGNDWPFTGEILARAVDTARAFIKDIPAVDAVPVVHARWTEGTTRIGMWRKCSVCGVEQTERDAYGYMNSFKFCPKCGARMDGDA